MVRWVLAQTKSAGPPCDVTPLGMPLKVGLLPSGPARHFDTLEGSAAVTACITQQLELTRRAGRSI